MELEKNNQWWPLVNELPNWLLNFFGELKTMLIHKWFVYRHTDPSSHSKTTLQMMYCPGQTRVYWYNKKMHYDKKIKKKWTGWRKVMSLYHSLKFIDLVHNLNPIFEIEKLTWFFLSCLISFDLWIANLWRHSNELAWANYL